MIPLPHEREHGVQSSKFVTVQWIGQCVLQA